MSVNVTQWTETLRDYLSQTNITPKKHRIKAKGTQLEKLPNNHLESINQPANTVRTSPTVKTDFRANMIDHNVLKAIDPRVFQRSQLAIQAKPQWTISARHVYKQTPPVPTLSQPLRVGDFLLFPDPVQDYVNLDSATELVQKLSNELYRKDTLNRFSAVEFQQPLLLENFRLEKMRIQIRRAFFTAMIPRKQDFRMVIRRNEKLQIESGTAYLTVDIYSQVDSDIFGSYRNLWTKALADAGYGTHLWKFVPVSLIDVQTSLSLNPNLQNGPASIVVNAELGTVTIVIHLSSTGAQIWQQAFEKRQLHQLDGICYFRTSYYARQSDHLRIEEQSSQVILAKLLQDCGPDVIQIVSSEVTLETLIQVEGSQLLESVVVEWQPNQGAANISRVFDAKGGKVTGKVVTQNLDNVAIDWSAQIHYKLAGWPTISQTGRFQRDSLTEIIKPISSRWIQEFILYTVYMAGHNQVFTEGQAFDDIEVEGTLTFMASYLTSPLTTAFELSNFAITDVPFPRRPGQIPKSIMLTITTRSRSRNKVLQTQDRLLTLEDTFLNTKIYSDGGIEIQSSADPVAELSIDAEIFALLIRLYPS